MSYEPDAIPARNGYDPVSYPETQDDSTPMWASLLVFAFAAFAGGIFFHFGWNVAGLVW